MKSATTSHTTRLKQGFIILACIILASFWVGNAQEATYQEAPELAERVAAGELPPVEDRLPVEPLVLEPTDRIGVHGGTWRFGLRGGADNSAFSRTFAHDNLVRFAPNSTRIIPNVARAFDVSDDATEFTFHLREGLRWSDGAPYTADDIMFWYEDILTNEDHVAFRPVRDFYLSASGEPVLVEKINDYTVVFRFDEPNALFLQNLANRNGFEPTRYPRHFLEQFHPDYQDEETLEQLIAQYSQTDWVTLMDFIVGSVGGTGEPDLPTLYAWTITSRYGDGPRLVAERNPYYWKVDPEGNQLPYIDRIAYDLFEDIEVLVLRALNGEIDYQERHIATPANRAVFFDNQERGDYRLEDVVPSSMNTMMIALNMNHQDPVMRDIFQNKDFRIGLSHAINRQEIIDLVYVGQGEPWQGAPRPESEFYDETLAKQYTEYDVDLANEYLDQAGYTERDSAGFRVGPNGERIVFVVEVTSGQQDRIDTMELVRGYWAEVGIDIQVRTMDRSLLYTRKDAGLHDANVWGGDSGLEPYTEARWYFPSSNESNFAPAWAEWFMNPEGVGAEITPEEPPEQVRRQMELFNQLMVTGDQERQEELMNEILAIAQEQFYAIGISLPGPGYSVVRNNFQNTLDGAIHFVQFPAHTNPPQFFIED